MSCFIGTSRQIKSCHYILLLLVSAIFIRGSGEAGGVSFTAPQFISAGLVLLVPVFLNWRSKLQDIVFLLSIFCLLFLIEAINSGQPSLSIKVLIIGFVHLFIHSIPLNSRLSALKLYSVLALSFYLHDVYVRLAFSGAGYDFFALFFGLAQGETWLYGPSKFGSMFFFDSNFSAVLPLVVGLIFLAQAKNIKETLIYSSTPTASMLHM